MTAGDIDWPPPICDACQHEFHDHCIWLTGCECPSGMCLPLPDEED